MSRRGGETAGSSGCLDVPARDAGAWRRVGGLYALLLAMNVVAWASALVVFQGRPVQLAAALIAYGFGLRHAVDADHIAAIDVATRKLMSEGRRSADAGLFFALGHSTVVALLSVALALAASTVETRVPAMASLGAAVGAAVSILFLFGMALMNMVVFASVWSTYSALRAGSSYDERSLDLLLARRGFLGRLFRGLFRLVDRSWHMYPVGLLFGLGFDTATEIGVLGLSATAAGDGTGLWSIMIYPALFTAGMALVDTTDSVLMTGAYRWALDDPMRKLRYNMVITGLSVATAVVVGTMEVVGSIGEHVDPHGGFARAVSAAMDSAGDLGVGVIVLFLSCWGGSIILNRAENSG